MRSKSVQSPVDSLDGSIREGQLQSGTQLPFEAEIMSHFADLMTYLGTMIIPRTRVNTMLSAPEGWLKYLQRVHNEHENIYEAIQKQDVETARAAMRMHLSNSRERLQKGNNLHTMQP